MKKLRLDEKVGCTVFLVNHRESHIVLNNGFLDETICKKLCFVCPADVYTYDYGCLYASYEGCLECGACRLLGINRALKSWDYPRNGHGVEYHQN